MRKHSRVVNHAGERFLSLVPSRLPPTLPQQSRARLRGDKLLPRAEQIAVAQNFLDFRLTYSPTHTTYINPASETLFAGAD